MAGIPVRQSCRRLHLVHAAIHARETADNTAIGRYVVHFANGQNQQIPIVLGQDLQEWFQEQAPPNKRYAVAWTGSNGRTRKLGGRVYLFKYTWENPCANIPIQSLEFESTHHQAFPFLVAITAE